MIRVALALLALFLVLPISPLIIAALSAWWLSR